MFPASSAHALLLTALQFKGSALLLVVLDLVGDIGHAHGRRPLFGAAVVIAGMCRRGNEKKS